MSFNISLRPKDFDDFIGNQTIIKSLKSIIKSDHPPHTYLFSGPSGCGKTTLARILTDSFGCKNSSIFEINSSNNRGVDSAREIIGQCIYTPLEGEIKVYILDEIHKATNEFQNAMLKILEEPPLHVFFILCTTDPQKLLKAVKSRCTAFKVEKPSSDELFKYLIDICEKNNIPKYDNVINTIIEQSEGVPRDSLILLDKIKDIKGATQAEVINLINSDSETSKEIIDICRALIKQNATWEEVRILLKNINVDPEGIRRAVLGYASAVLLNKSNQRACNIIECFKNNFYDSGKPGLVAACYKVVNNINRGS